MEGHRSHRRSLGLLLAALLLLLWLPLSGCRNSPASAHERRVQPLDPSPTQTAAPQSSEPSALRRMDSFFNKPLGVELIEE